MKLAFWISRDRILPAQEKLLKDAEYEIIIYNKGIYNVEDFLNEIRDFDDEIYQRVLLIPIVPESVKMKLLEEIRNRNLKFEIVEPVMKELGRFKDSRECIKILAEGSDRRVAVTLKDSTCKVYEFVEFKRLVEYVKRYDDGWSL